MIFPSKSLAGLGLPGCFLKNPKVTVAEVAIFREAGVTIAAGMVFRDEGEDPKNCFTFGGLARPTGNDFYLLFLCGNMEVTKNGLRSSAK